MHLKAKSVLRILLILFALYAIFTSPQQSADIVRAIWEVLKNGVTNLGNFFDALLNHR